MKPVIQKLSKGLDTVELHALSDWHIGDKLCDYKRILDEVEEIKNNPNAYAILAGDLINNSTIQSIGDTYEEKIPPMEQIKKAVETIEPIKDKILCAVGGNHEYRSYKTDGLDITRFLCLELGIDSNYRPESCYMFLSFGQKSRYKARERRQTYTVYVTHGSRGGRKMGGRANALADEALICDADIFIIGHTHSPLVFKDRYYRQTACAGSIEPVERVYVNTAAALDYGGYAAKAGYQPASKSNPIIVLNGTKREIEVRL